MVFRGLDINLLVVLDVLLEEKNVTRAGQRIHLSQSATSGTLARLRDFFNDELLVMVGHRMVLTPMAEELVRPVKELLLHVQVVINKTPVFNPLTSTRRFTLMLSDYVASTLLPAVVERMEREAPGVSLELVPVTDLPTETLERGEVDFLILPEDYFSPDQPSEELFRESYACVVWSENDLVGDTISMEQYLRMGHVAVRFGKQRSRSLDDWFLSRSGHIRNIELITMDFNLMLQLLVGTSRIATIQRRLAEHYARYLPLRILEPPIETPVLVEKLAWHSYRDRDPGHQWLRGIVRDAASAFPKLIPQRPPVARDDNASPVLASGVAAIPGQAKKPAVVKTSGQKAAMSKKASTSKQQSKNRKRK